MLVKKRMQPPNSPSDRGDEAARGSTLFWIQQDAELFRVAWELAPDAMVLSDPEGCVLAANPAYLTLYGLTPDEVLGQDFAVIFPPEARAWAREQYHVIFNAPAIPADIESSVQRKDGARLNVQTRINFIERDGQRVAMQSIIRDITPLKQAQAAAERTADRLEHLQRVTAALAQAARPAEIFEIILRQGADSLDAKTASVKLLTADGQWLESVGMPGFSADTKAAYTGYPLAASNHMSDAVRSGEPIWLETAAAHAARYPETAATLAAEGLEATCVLPLRHAGHVIGGLGFGFTRPLAFTPEEREFLLNLANQCSLALVRAQLYADAEAARQAAEQTAERLLRLQAVTTALSTVESPQAAARYIVDQSLEVLAGQTGALVLLDAAGELLQLVYQAGYAPGVLDPYLRIPLSADVPLANVTRSGEPYFSESREAWAARFPHLANVQTGNAALAVVPLTVEDRCLGAISVGFAQPQAFSPADRAFLLNLGQQCAQALERAGLYAGLQARVAARTAELVEMNAQLTAEIEQRHAAEAQLAVSFEQLRALTRRLEEAREEERQRLARDLHDQLGGALTSLKMELRRLARHSDGAIEPAALSALNVDIDEMTQLVRRIASDLRPPVLDDMGLLAALEWQLQDFNKRAGLAIVFEAPRELPALSPEASIAVFRVFQECLTNVGRHSNATGLEVRITADARDLQLTVQDNGRGFDPGTFQVNKTLGLLGMRERLRAINGEVSIFGQPDMGTTVALRVPLHGA